MSDENMTLHQMDEELEKLKASTVRSKILPLIDSDLFVQGEDFNWGDLRDSDKGIVYVVQFDGFTRDIQMLLTEMHGTWG